jgi:RimJ/RimL family protein N-acetyltransferase
MEVVLRDVEEADLGVLYEHQADPVAAEMAAFPSRDREAFMAHWGRILAARGGEGGPIARAIVVDGQVAGNVACWEHLGERLVGYWIGREFWGRGIATRALELLLDELRVRPLRARVSRANPASIRVLEKCGFVACGPERGTVRGLDVDEIVYVRR